jgi:hypothetical protein
MQAAKSTALKNCLPSTRQPPPFRSDSLARSAAACAQSSRQPAMAANNPRFA